MITTHMDSILDFYWKHQVSRDVDNDASILHLQMRYVKAGENTDIKVFHCCTGSVLRVGS